MRRCALWGTLGVGLLLATGCSNDDAANPGEATTTTTAGAGGSSTSISTTSTATGISTTGSAGESSTTHGGPKPSVADADGWRLVVSNPTAGATIGPVTTLCVTIAGTGREPEVALDVTLLGSGASAHDTTVRVGASVGRRAVRVGLKAAPGEYDLRVQLVADGKRIDKVAVTIPVVTFAAIGAPSTCA